MKQLSARLDSTRLLLIKNNGDSNQLIFALTRHKNTKTLGSTSADKKMVVHIVHRSNSNQLILAACSHSSLALASSLSL